MNFTRATLSLGTLKRFPTGNYVPSFRGRPKRYSTSELGSKGSGSEKWWVIGTMTILIPGAYWVYKNQYGSPEPPTIASTLPDSIPVEFLTFTRSSSQQSNGTILVSDVREVQQGIKEGMSTSASSDSSDGDSMLPDGTLQAKYLLLGGGIASFAAMEQIRRMEPNADILIVGEETYAPYLRAPLSKEIWFNKDEESTKRLEFVDWHGEKKPIFFQPFGFYETVNIQRISKKPRLILGKRAVSLDAANSNVTLDDGRIIKYDKVLIATGGRPKLHPSLAVAPPECQSMFSTFRRVDDYHRLVGLLSPEKHIAIVGGGFLGSELAVALAQHSQAKLDGQLKISQIFPENGNLATVFPRYLSRWTTSRISKAGVNVCPNAQIKSVKKDPKSSSDNPKLLISLSDGNELVVDHIISAVGIIPNVEIASSAGLECDKDRGGILTNSELMVKSNIFAAGDVISYYDVGLGLRRRVEHYDNAFLSGRVAGANMVSPAGRAISYDNQSIFWSELGPDVGFEAVGLVDSRLTTIGVWAEASDLDSPRASYLDPSDVRAQVIGNISNRTSGHDNAVSTSELQQPVIKSPSGEKTYGKGVVFYVKDRRIVGMVMFNIFNRYSLATTIIKEDRTIDDLQELVELFNVNEHKNGVNTI